MVYSPRRQTVVWVSSAPSVLWSFGICEGKRQIKCKCCCLDPLCKEINPLLCNLCLTGSTGAGRIEQGRM